MREVGFESKRNRIGWGGSNRKEGMTMTIVRKVVVGAIFGTSLGIFGVPFVDIVSPESIPELLSIPSGTVLGVVTALKVIA